MEKALALLDEEQVDFGDHPKDFNALPAPEANKEINQYPSVDSLNLAATLSLAMKLQQENM